MATMKQVVNKYTNKVIKMAKEAGRQWDNESAWEINIETTQGYKEVQESFHNEMKNATDFVKEGRPDKLERSIMIEDKLDEKFNR